MTLLSPSDQCQSAVGNVKALTSTKEIIHLPYPC